MSKFDKIRPYYDSEVNHALRELAHHPMMKAMMNFAYPNVEDSVWKEHLLRTYSIRDFQINFAYQAIKKILEKTSDGLTTSGFEKLEPHTAYFFISNHRDIILDTSLLNVCLFDHDLIMTASAIGDNLVKKDFLLKLSKLNRNFLVQRGLPPRELLQSSKLLSEYMYHLVTRENRSVWIAQREGRTKDGNDATHQGVLKMIAMANDEVYIKDKNEDFITLLSGIIGQKKRIHIHVGDVLNHEIDQIKATNDNNNKQIQDLAKVIDDYI